MKRIAFSEDAKTDIRSIPQAVAMNILTAIHRLAETGSGRVKALQGDTDENRLRVGDFRVRFTVESGKQAGGKQAGEDDILRIHSVRTEKTPIGNRRRLVKSLEMLSGFAMRRRKRPNPERNCSSRPSLRAPQLTAIAPAVP